MNVANLIPLAKAAILTMDAIKSATEAFDRGEANVFDALDAIVLELKAYRAATTPRREVA
jgi:hypothetical protein